MPPCFLLRVCSLGFKGGFRANYLHRSLFYMCRASGPPAILSARKCRVMSGIGGVDTDWYASHQRGEIGEVGGGWGGRASLVLNQCSPNVKF